MKTKNIKTYYKYTYYTCACTIQLLHVLTLTVLCNNLIVYCQNNLCTFCMYMYMYVLYMYISTYCLHIHVYMFVTTCTCVCVCIHVYSVYLCIYVRMCVYMYECVHVCKYVHVCIIVYMCFPQDKILRLEDCISGIGITFGQQCCKTVH